MKNDAVTLSAVCEKGKIYVEAARYRNRGRRGKRRGLLLALAAQRKQREKLGAGKKVEGEALRFNLEIFDADTPVRAFLNVTYKKRD